MTPWFLAMFCGLCVLSLLGAVTSVLRLRALLHHGYHLPVWYLVIFAVQLISCVLVCVATWFLGQERLPLKTRGLFWGTAFLTWAISRAAWRWRVGIVDWLVFAFALGKSGSTLRPNWTH